MPFNLLTDPLFPVRMQSGVCQWRAFPNLTAAASHTEDVAVEFAWPRSDLNVASFEFCIGVISLAFDIRDEDDWRALWRDPPNPQALTTKLAPLTHAFDLDGDGPRFMQDSEELDGDETPIEQLLIDTPGASGQRKNADVLTHRARYLTLGQQAAAMSLYALQAYAPTGGQGHRTSMRGGGPLTALVIPTASAGAPPVSLWRKVVANVGHREPLQHDDLPRVLPWLAPTLVSNQKGRGRAVLHQSDAETHQLHVFFGMPRRIRLVFSSETGVCPMTGTRGPLVTGFVQKPGGVNYGLWHHPLTPYRRQTEAGELYSVKPKSGRFGYRDWVAVTIGNQGGVLTAPPMNLHRVRSDRLGIIRGEPAVDPRVRVGGWAMDNMEAVAYLFAEQPLHLARTPVQQSALDEQAQTFADAADLTEKLLRTALKRAFVGQQAPTHTARTAFFGETEDQFYELLDTLLRGMPDDGRLSDPLEPRTRWLRIVRSAAHVVFDRLAPLPVEDPDAARNIVQSYGWLSASFAGYTSGGKALYRRLGLPLPDKAPKWRKTEEATA